MNISSDCRLFFSRHQWYSEFRAKKKRHSSPDIFSILRIRRRGITDRLAQPQAATVGKETRKEEKEKKESGESGDQFIRGDGGLFTGQHIFEIDFAFGYFGLTD